MRFVVYTSVFGRYDRVFPPVVIDTGVDYVVFTDNPDLRVSGWRIVPVESRSYSSARSANRYYKMLGHREMPGYAASIYVDANIRLLGPLAPILQEFMDAGSALGAYPHPLRHSVAEEVRACIDSGKMADAATLQAELESYQKEGFDDRQGLMEAGVLLKNHDHPSLDRAMSLWFEEYERWGTRDQISLPYVLWKTRVPCHRFSQSFRESKDHFAIYPHFGAKNVSEPYAYVSARSHDSSFYGVLLRAWHAKWRAQRFLRGVRSRTP